MSFSALSAADSQLNDLINRLSQLPTCTIGRRADNSITISNGKVSGQHARLILCTTSSFVLEDLDSKNGTFVNSVRITRKVVGQQDQIQFADSTYSVAELLDLNKELAIKSINSASFIQVSPTTLPAQKSSLDFTNQFTDLQRVFDQYPKLRKNCRNREKMIRTGSVILSSIVGISTVLSTGGGSLPVLQLMSGAGLSMLVPTLCSTLLSTEEKLEIIDKEYREQYRCPNPACRDPFGAREWELLALQKTCKRCQAIWVN